MGDHPRLSAIGLKEAQQATKTASA